MTGIVLCGSEESLRKRRPNAPELGHPFSDEVLHHFVLLRAANTDVLPPLPTQLQQPKVPLLESEVAGRALLVLLRRTRLRICAAAAHCSCAH